MPTPIPMPDAVFNPHGAPVSPRIEAVIQFATSFIFFAQAMEKASSEDMLLGVHVEVKGDELAALMRKRATAAAAEADVLEAKRKALPEDAPVYDREPVFRAENALRADAARLSFTADHLSPTRTYRLMPSEVASLFGSSNF